MIIASIILFVFVGIYVLANYLIWKDPIRLFLILMTNLVAYSFMAKNMSMLVSYFSKELNWLPGELFFLLSTSEEAQFHTLVAGLIGWFAGAVLLVVRDWLLHRRSEQQRFSGRRSGGPQNDYGDTDAQRTRPSRNLS